MEFAQELENIRHELTFSEQDFHTLVEAYDVRDKEREELIVASRSVIKLAKQLIYALHRSDMEKAEQLVEELKSSSLAVLALPVGARSAAVQEAIEALAFYYYRKNYSLVTYACANEFFSCTDEDYLLGLADFGGELVREATNAAIASNVSGVMRAKVFVEELYKNFIRFDFRNSELRKKTDALRWHTQKIDELLVAMKR